MPVAFPSLRVGDPIRHQSLSVFPLFSESDSRVEYLLSEEALADESVVVEEVDEDGDVPDLLVENKGDVRVLFLEGEEFSDFPASGYPGCLLFGLLCLFYNSQEKGFQLIRGG